MIRRDFRFMSKPVSPYIGEWIEMSKVCSSANSLIVSPYIGEWIEIIWQSKSPGRGLVSPYIGEWIEIKNETEQLTLASGLTLHR